MKQLILSLLLVTFVMATDAKEAAKQLGAEYDFATAMSKAKAEKKMVVMVIVKEHCRWCHKLIDRTLMDEKVHKALQKSYVTLIVDRNDPYPSEFKENFFPSIFFIDEKTGKSIYENVGYVETKSFLNDLKSALKTRNELYIK